LILEGNGMNEAVFKTTVMGGFSKSDVLAFIDKQDRQFKDREKDLLARVESLSKELKDATQKNEELSQRAAFLEKQFEQAQSKSAEAGEKILAAENAARQAKSTLEQTLVQRDAEIARLRDEATALTKKAAEAEAKAAEAASRADTLSHKLELIDKTEDQIGRALLDAQQTADKIAGSAGAQADALLQKAKADAQALAAQAKAEVDTLNTIAQKKLDLLLDAVSDYDRRIADKRADVAEFFHSADSAFGTMRDSAKEILDVFSVAFRGQSGTEAAAQDPETTDEPFEADSAGEFSMQEDTCPQDDVFKSEAAAIKFDFRKNDDRDDE
jgi:cell division septum initiation protein DivIVA